MNQYELSIADLDLGGPGLGNAGRTSHNALAAILEDLKLQEERRAERLRKQARFREQNPEWANAPKEWLDELIP